MADFVPKKSAPFKIPLVKSHEENDVAMSCSPTVHGLASSGGGTTPREEIKGLRLSYHDQQPINLKTFASTHVNKEGNAGGCVACGDRYTASAMRGILNAGGNAMDAAIAGLLVSCTSEAMLCSIAGGGFFVVRTAKEDKETVIDAMPRMPATCHADDMTQVEVDFGETQQQFWIGSASSAPPALLAGILYAHKKYGSLSFSRVVAPAIEIARRGVVLNAFTANTFRLLKPILQSKEQSAHQFMVKEKDNSYRSYQSGDRFKNEEFATFLENLVKNPDPEILAKDYEKVGIVYEPSEIVERKPLENVLCGHRICTVPPPYPGGLLMQHSLQHMKLDTFDEQNQVDQYCEFSEAFIQTHEARTKYVDGATLDGSVVAKLLAKDSHLGGTTHISVIDGVGNAVSVTVTNGEGSGVVLPGLGIMTSNLLGEKDLHPTGFGKHPKGACLPSMMCPTLVQNRDGTWAALGSGGSERIRSAVSQVVLRMLSGSDVPAAVRAPRVHWDGKQLHVECPPPAAYGNLDPSHVAKENQLKERALAEAKHASLLADLARYFGDRAPLNPWYRYSMYFGGVHVAYQCSVHRCNYFASQTPKKTEAEGRVRSCLDQADQEKKEKNHHHGTPSECLVPHCAAVGDLRRSGSAA